MQLVVLCCSTITAQSVDGGTNRFALMTVYVCGLAGVVTRGTFISGAGQNSLGIVLETSLHAF